MNVLRNSLLLGALLASRTFAAVLNDGTTTANLVPLAGAPSAVDAPMTLTAASGVLQVEQRDFFLVSGAPLTTWYYAGTIATQVTYTVSADFLPALAGREYRGGVSGWLDTQAGVGLAAFTAYETEPGVVLAAIDFTSGRYSGDHLYTLTGEAVGGTAPRLLLLPAYQAQSPVTLELVFTAPTTVDTNALPAATVHLKAQAWQSSGTSRTAVSDAFEYLCDLPLPAPDNHRFGYFALWGSLLGPLAPELIGSLDNLTASGALGVANLPPTITLTGPADGATYVAPATISLTATAIDTDGQIVRVDYYSGTDLIATATNTPFTASWPDVAAGSYTISARATDNSGASASSAPATITVSESAGDAILTIVNTGGTVTVSWNRSGYQLQSTTGLGSGNWTEIPTSGTQHSESATGPQKYYRLVGSGVPAGPTLTVTATGGILNITWSQTGYVLEAKSDLNATTWTEVSATSPYTESIPATTGVFRYFRLRRL